MSGWSRIIVSGCTLFLLALLAGCSGSAEREQEFTAGYAAYVEQSTAGARATVRGPLDVQVVFGDGREVTADLKAPFEEWRKSGGERAVAYARFHATLRDRATAPAGAGLDVSRVLPVVKNRSFRDSLLAMAGKGSGEVPAHEALNEELFVFYVQDTPDAQHFLSEKEISAAGFDASSRRARAVENLRAFLPDVQVRGSDGFFLVTADGTYEASLLLTEDLWENPTLAVQGDLVVAVPSREVLIVTGANDASNLARMREVVTDATARGANLVSPRLFVRRAGRWAVFE